MTGVEIGGIAFATFNFLRLLWLFVMDLRDRRKS